jgi:hypothetical protein
MAGLFLYCYGLILLSKKARFANKWRDSSAFGLRMTEQIGFAITEKF